MAKVPRLHTRHDTAPSPCQFCFACFPYRVQGRRGSRCLMGVGGHQRETGAASVPQWLTHAVCLVCWNFCCLSVLMNAMQEFLFPDSRKGTRGAFMNLLRNWSVTSHVCWGFCSHSRWTFLLSIPRRSKCITNSNDNWHFVILCSWKLQAFDSNKHLFKS